MKLGLAIDDVQDAEMELAKQLVAMADRHLSDSDVYHMSLARAHVCAEHVWKLRPFVEQYEAHAVDVEDATTPGFVDTLRKGAAAVIGHTPVSGVVLVKDLRETYLLANRVEISWIILQQAAKAARDANLLEVITACHEEAEQSCKWLRTHIKVSAPEALATS
jgi:hypothetical protein